MCIVGSSSKSEARDSGRVPRARGHTWLFSLPSPSWQSIHPSTAWPEPSGMLCGVRAFSSRNYEVSLGTRTEHVKMKTSCVTLTLS